MDVCSFVVGGWSAGLIDSGLLSLNLYFELRVISLFSLIVINVFYSKREFVLNLEAISPAAVTTVEVVT